MKQSDGVSFVLSSVKAIPGGSGVPSFNGELECHLGLQVSEQGASRRWNDRNLVDLINEVSLIDRYWVDHLR